MIKANYHTHSRFCDGSGDLKDYLEKALSLGWKELGFSSHAPLSFNNDWTMSESEFPSYKKEIFEIREAYRDQINILFGLECDFIPGVASPKKEKKNRGLDYVIGSVHFLGKRRDGEYWTVDGGMEELRRGVEDVFKGDYIKGVKEYYRLVREMALNEKPDIIGHMDLIKKNNSERILFHEEDQWYRQEVLTTLDVIRESGCVLEINTGGLNRKKTDDYYPSSWIIKEAHTRGIPMIANSDAHIPRDLNGNFDRLERFINVHEISVKDYLF